MNKSSFYIGLSKLEGKSDEEIKSEIVKFFGTSEKEFVKFVIDQSSTNELLKLVEFFKKAPKLEFEIELIELANKLIDFIRFSYSNIEISYYFEQRLSRLLNCVRSILVDQLRTLIQKSFKDKFSKFFKFADRLIEVINLISSIQRSLTAKNTESFQKKLSELVEFPISILANSWVNLVDQLSKKECSKLIEHLRNEHGQLNDGLLTDSFKKILSKIIDKIGKKQILKLIEIDVWNKSYFFLDSVNEDKFVELTDKMSQNERNELFELINSIPELKKKDKIRFASIDINILKIDSVGKDVAENEKDDLNKYFISTEAYLNSKNPKRKKLFYIGHRGSGKSALFKQLIHEYSKRCIIIEIKPSDYSYQAFEQVEHNFIDKRVAFSSAWRLTLIVQIFKEVCKFFEERRNIRSNRDNIKTIKDYLIKNNFEKIRSKLRIFANFLSEFEKATVNLKLAEFKVLDFEFAKKKNTTNKLVDLLALEDIRQPLNALQQIISNIPVYIFLDELDTGWNNSKEAKHFINGLISAAGKINQIDQVDVFLSLRQDMFNNLNGVYNDTEKIRGQIELISWDTRMLKDLIGKRILDNQVVKDKIDDIDCSNNQILNLIFEEGVFDYILGHTLYRPRELIGLCNAVLNNYRTNYRDRKNKKVDLENVKSENVISKYTDNRFKDFCAEYNYEFPQIEKFLVKFEGQPSTYTRENFKEILENFMVNFDNLNWINSFLDHPYLLMTKLFEMGFIKMSIDDQTNFFAHYEKVFKNPRGVKYIQFNKVFAIALNCTEESIAD